RDRPPTSLVPDRTSNELRVRRIRVPGSWLLAPHAKISLYYSSRRNGLMQDILTRLRAIPGVESVGLAGALPVAAGDDLADGTFLILNGQKPPANFDEWERIAQNPSQVGHASYCVAGEEYFRTIGIPLIRGRMFGEQD